MDQCIHVLLHCLTIRQHNFGRVGFDWAWFQSRQRLHTDLVRLFELAHVNGDSREFSEGLLLSDLLGLLELPIQRIAVELNREVVRRTDWDKTVLRDEDRIEIVHFVGGG